MDTASRKDISLITMTVKWLNLAGPSGKPTTDLQLALQTWFNKNKTGTTCSVLSQLDDGSFMIKIEPASTWSEFQKLNGQTLTSKNKTATITSINGRSQQQETQTSEAASVNLHPSSTLQKDDVEMYKVKHNAFSGAAMDSRAEELTCVLPVSYFWYMSQVYKEQLQHIEEATGVKITAEEKVTFGSSGDQQKALSEFINLYQKSLREFSFEAVPVKDVHTEAWSNTKKITQKSDNKVLVQHFNNSVGKSTDPEFNAQLASGKDKDEAAGDDEDEKCCICMDAFKDKRRLKCKHEFCSECLKKSEESLGPFCPLCKDVFGVNVEHQKLSAASYDGHLQGSRSKFSAHFNVLQTDVCKDKVDVKVCHRRPAGNALKKSHGARASRGMLHVWQRQTSPIPLTHLQGASGFSGSPQNRTHGSKIEGSSTDPVFNAQVVSVKNKDEAAGDDEDEKCCICMDAFKDKRRLKCKHEFCSECLKRFEESLGPFCPLCKDMFGVIEGNQPDGQMTWCKHSVPLPGFYDCGTIEINYNIPSGKQTDKHPNPGQLYHGIYRAAFLPDNKEGNEVLHLLKRAFDQKLIFTVGSSRTTGLDNQVTWNDIHHKTSILGGPQGFGYPDPDYLFRVKEELKAKGIK